MKREDLRIILFEKFSANCKFVTNENVKKEEHKFYGDFICPLCCKGFSRKDLNQDLENPLTVEDVPPKSLKGKPITITCKKCNSKSGQLLDADLKRLIDWLNFKNKKPNTRANVKLDFKGIKLNGVMLFNKDGKADFEIEKSRNNPKNWDSFVLQAMEGEITNEDKMSFTAKAGGSDYLNFEVVDKMAHIKRAFLSILRAGYLYAYTKFGAEFLQLNPNLKIIRQQIDNPNEEIIPNYGVFSFSLSEKYVGVNWAPSLNCYISVFKIELNGIKYYTGVILPGPFTNSLEKFKKLDEYKNQEETLSAKKLPDVDYFRKENFGLLTN